MRYTEAFEWTNENISMLMEFQINVKLTLKSLWYKIKDSEACLIQWLWEME